VHGIWNLPWWQVAQVPEQMCPHISFEWQGSVQSRMSTGIPAIIKIKMHHKKAANDKPKLFS
jgi:hypothetical protein